MQDGPRPERQVGFAMTACANLRHEPVQGVDGFRRTHPGGDPDRLPEPDGTEKPAAVAIGVDPLRVPGWASAARRW